MQCVVDERLGQVRANRVSGVDGGGTVFDIATVVAVVDMIIIDVVVVVLIGSMICRHFTAAFAATRTTSTRCRVDTSEAFLNAAAAYGR